MSAAIMLSAALLAALKDHAPLNERLNGITAAPAIRKTVPYAVLGAVVSRDWSTKTEVGRELRFTISLFEQNERADRLAELMAEAETAIAAIPRDLPDWHIVSCVFLRARIDRSGNPWEGILDFRARLLAA